MKVPRQTYNFFQVEIRNEEFSSSIACLRSAYNSAQQAPVDILDSWCGGPSEGLLEEIELLMAKYGISDLEEFELASPLDLLAECAE